MGICYRKLFTRSFVIIYHLLQDTEQRTNLHLLRIGKKLCSGDGDDHASVMRRAVRTANWHPICSGLFDGN